MNDGGDLMMIGWVCEVMIDPPGPDGRTAVRITVPSERVTTTPQTTSVRAGSSARARHGSATKPAGAAAFAWRAETAHGERSVKSGSRDSKLAARSAMSCRRPGAAAAVRRPVAGQQNKSGQRRAGAGRRDFVVQLGSSLTRRNACSSGRRPVSRMK